MGEDPYPYAKVLILEWKGTGVAAWDIIDTASHLRIKGMKSNIGQKLTCSRR
jgi:hypothetical protein